MGHMSEKKDPEKEKLPPVRISKENHIFVQIISKQARRTLRNQLDLIIEQWKKDHPEAWKGLLD